MTTESPQLTKKEQALAALGDFEKAWHAMDQARDTMDEAARHGDSNVLDGVRLDYGDPDFRGARRAIDEWSGDPLD
jgi:hypothetical protein